MNIKRFFVFVFGLVLIGFALRYAYIKIDKYMEERASYLKRKAAWAGLMEKLDQEVDKFRGAGIVIKDLDTGFEYALNEDGMFASASLVKIPIMADCLLCVKQGRIRLDELVKLKKSDKTSGSGDLESAPAGTMYTVDNLIGLMIYNSDNTASNMLINLLGIDHCNSLFKEFGLKNTNLSRMIADYRSRKKGIENYTTASDMAVMLEDIYRGRLISPEMSERSLEVLKKQHLRDRIPRYLPQEIAVAHKTGLENGVCHDVGIVYTPKGDFLICVLTKHNNTTAKLSKEFIGRLALCTYNYFLQLDERRSS